MKIQKLSAAAAAACLMSSSFVYADVSVTTFGPQPGDTFASHSVDNTQVESTTIQDGVNTIKLDLTSTPRGATAPAVGNNGNGTFYATPGHTVQFGLNLPLWSFDYSITVDNNAFNDYTYKLIYGNGTQSAFFDPTVSGVPDDSNVTVAGVTSQQNDENLGFATGLPGGFPSIGFNPDANGTYTFELEAFNANGTPVGSDSITVDVAAAPDAASTCVLLGMGALGLFAFSRKFSMVS